MAFDQGVIGIGAPPPFAFVQGVIGIGAPPPLALDQGVIGIGAPPPATICALAVMLRSPTALTRANSTNTPTINHLLIGTPQVR